MAAIGVLAIAAGFQWLQAERHRQNAEQLAARAQAEEARTKQALASEAEVTAKLQEQLRQASWASFNQAERQFQLGEWQEGIAHLARAIKFNPANQVASERFFQELIVHREVLQFCRKFEPEMILLAVGWYLRFSLSYRDVEELLAERGLLVDHVTVWRWV
jgi:tetratricopeptide (TPR) repeat protein